MLSYVRLFLILMMGWGCLSQASTQTAPSSHVKIELIQEEETIQPGRPFWIALHLELEKDWHVYWKNPGDVGIPLKVEWILPSGFHAAPLQWPFPEKFSAADMVGFGYTGTVTLLTQVTPPSELTMNDKIDLKAKIDWLVCSSLTCQPGSATVNLPLQVTNEPPRAREQAALIFEQARVKIPKSHVEIKTVRKDNIVQLEVPNAMDEKKGEIREAYFFPEEQNVIDHSVDPTFHSISEGTNRYLVNLKGSDQIGAKIQALKGVLVLHTQDGAQENIQAFDIDSPIEDERDAEVLSFLSASHRSNLSSAVGNPNSAPESSAFAFEGGLGLALLFAFLGGMILNLMPCVLPVMSFKVLSFVKMAGQSRSLTLKHGLMFSLGVVLSFWVLASVMLMLRAYGESVGWGFQLQEPLFVVILASLLFIFALNLFGVFEWGMFFASWAGQTQAETTQKSSGYVGSFFSGVLATAVATPCTGPFLGSAVGFAVTLPLFQSLLIFTSLALGMCFPYLLLAAFPSFLRFMPKPGAWMETFKQLMGFLLLATVLWLMWVFSAQTDTFSLICLLVGFFCFSIGAWIYGRGCSPLATRKTRIVSYACVALFTFAGVQAILFPKATWNAQSSVGSSGDQWDGWEDFSPARVAQLRKEGKPVFIDFTAKWCLICQANHMVLATDDVKKQLNAHGVVKMKADWTKNDPVITEELSKFGRNSVPLYVFYGPDHDKDAVILPQVLTPDVVAEHINQTLPEDIALR